MCKGLGLRLRDLLFSYGCVFNGLEAEKSNCGLIIQGLCHCGLRFRI